MKEIKGIGGTIFRVARIDVARNPISIQRILSSGECPEFKKRREGAISGK